MEFSGQESLSKGEPDTSSLIPIRKNIRATFEARGYTAWDFAASPVLVREDTTRRNIVHTYSFLLLYR